MSVCFECRYFKQTASLDFTVSGSCGWKSSEPLPPWLKSYVGSTDTYYGPKREVGKKFSGYEVKSCDAFEQEDDLVIRKRKSEEWYD
jgi:hypothetical protein